MTAFSNLAIYIRAQQNSTELAEKVRADALSSWTTVGVVSALILTMVKFTDKAEQQFSDDPWLDCNEFICSEIHVALSGIAMVASTFSVVYATNAYTWMCMTTVDRTADFIETFPGALAFPSDGMIVGVLAW
eukprot:CAMPEP_0177162636 /NCGR_PEP_ID=MMETSP0367-20130122/5988_1 /TAXON_ID=447022 ORGANISM="Scrippsiella hangoei-like, Strain SHHI-4" /NCGR_SAMPLE_ID=MMETSP0367 /ASSEMBLY_ACC=CAM_ASM_000362 /LENGTH=131 /DNA_ID=CAMNT_0018608415 /DNA_START=24 /DNA_END=416 /DNA_ORIENTATION=-